jgi:hypothetical protein
MSNEKALAIRPAAIIPTDYDGFGSLAERFAKSNLIPSDLRGKAEDVFVQLLAGHELGLTPMASLRGIHVVKGKPILAADTMVALVLARGAKYFRCIAESDTSVTYETLREGAPEPQRATWTIQDAERAGLTGDNWKKYPRAMLKARCKAVLARDVYPDVLAGCYDETERDEIEGRAYTPHVVRSEPDPHTGEIIDAEFKIEPAAPSDTFPALLALLEDIVKDDTSDWSDTHALQAIDHAMATADTGKICDERAKAWSGALDKAGASPRADAVRAHLRAAYPARKAALRAAAKGAAA